MTTDTVAEGPMLARYVEVATCASASRANKYLKAGYSLLNVMQGAAIVEPNKATGAPFTVRKYPIFIVGRTDGVAPLDGEDGAA